MNPPRKWNPKEAEAARQRLINEYIVPRFNEARKEYPAVRSMLLLVAQYWDDEANDAVHAKLAYSERNTPDIEAYLEAEKKHCWDDEEEWQGEGDPPAVLADVINLPTLPAEVHEKFFWGWYYPPGWPDNSDAIPAFAAFCREGAHQEMPAREAYSPYAVLRLDPSGSLVIEVIGTMHRDWLDGVKPEWECRD